MLQVQNNGNTKFHGTYDLETEEFPATNEDNLIILTKIDNMDVLLYVKV